MSTLYERRVMYGRELVRNYKNAKYILIKYCVEMLESFEGLTRVKLSSDLKININTLSYYLGVYKKSKKLFKKSENEYTFLLVEKAHSTYNVKFSEMTKKGLNSLQNTIDTKGETIASTFKRFTTSANKLTSHLLDGEELNDMQRQTILNHLQKINDVLLSKYTRVKGGAA